MNNGSIKQSEKLRHVCYEIRGPALQQAKKLEEEGYKILQLNIGNPVEMPIRHLAEKILEKVGGRSKLIFAALPVDDPMQRCPDISLAREKLKWEPKVALDQGLAKTIAYFDELLKSNKAVSRVGR